LYVLETDLTKAVTPERPARDVGLTDAQRDDLAASSYPK